MNRNIIYSEISKIIPENWDDNHCDECHAVMCKNNEGGKDECECMIPYNEEISKQVLAIFFKYDSTSNNDNIYLIHCDRNY